jgi:D-alanyl-D-alanine carboxypeptidase
VVLQLALAVTVALSSRQTQQVDAIVRTVMEQERISALSAGIARDGKVLFLRGFGKRDAGGRLADGYTVYPVGSITKQFTAALVMQEVGAGKLALDAPLQRYLPAIAPPDGDATIAQLLGQTSGIPSYTDHPRPQLLQFASMQPSPEQMWETVAAQTPAFTAGTSWQYSNSNYLLLGIVLQEVTGMNYPALLRERISSPLGLPSTAYGIPPFAQNVAMPSAATDAGIYDLAYSAGAMASNVPDLLAWLNDLRTGTVVAPQLFELMSRSGILSDGQPTHYGFGFFVDDWYGYRVISHGGNTIGFSSEDALVLDDGLELAILSNGDRVDLSPLAKSIVAIVDRPKDANLYADRPRPPENENPAVTKLVRATFEQRMHSTATLIEFIERWSAAGITYEKYRVTSNDEQYWMTLGIALDGSLDSVNLVPDSY